MKRIYVSPQVEINAVASFLLTGSLKVSDTEVDGGLVKGEHWDDEWEDAE